MEEVKWNVAGNARGISILHQPTLHNISMEEVEMECGWQREGNIHLTSTHLTQYKYGRGKNGMWLAILRECPSYINPPYIVRVWKR
jgi:hypothetical protein